MRRTLLSVVVHLPLSEARKHPPSDDHAHLQRGSQPAQGYSEIERFWLSIQNVIDF